MCPSKKKVPATICREGLLFGFNPNRGKESGQWIQPWKQQIILLIQGVHQTTLAIQAARIKRKLIKLPVGKEIDEVIGFPDLLPAQASELIFGECLHLTLAEAVQGCWLKTRDGIWINRFDLLGLEERKFIARKRSELVIGQT